jgi:hypothetical protein
VPIQQCQILVSGKTRASFQPPRNRHGVSDRHGLVYRGLAF